MKKTILAMGAFSALAFASTTTPALADGDEEAASSGFSGYVTLTSDYRFRGISQSDNGAALQADIAYTHSSGIFLEAWASNVDFSPFGDSDTSLEIDLTAGYEVALSDFTDFSIKAVYYAYLNQPDFPPGVDDANYFEFIAGISRKLGSTTLTVEAAYSPEYGSDGGVAWAGTAGLSAPLWKNVWFFDGIDGSAHLGVQGFDDSAVDYTFWDLGLTANYGNLALDARYVDTSLDTTDCGLDVCESGFVFSATFGWGG